MSGSLLSGGAARRAGALALAVLILWPSWATAQLLPRAQRGKTFARLYCASCHSIDRSSQSPLPTAPPFRTLHRRYPVETLQESLAEGIVTGHPTMPEFRLEPDQIDNLIAFLKTLER